MTWFWLWWTRVYRFLMTGREALLVQRRDDYGTLRITENSEGYRFLYFGEITEQSCVYPPDPAWLEYDYTRAMLLGCWWVAPRPEMTLLGLGGGALANALVAHFEPAQVRVVELRRKIHKHGAGQLRSAVCRPVHGGRVVAPAAAGRVFPQMPAGAATGRG